VGIKATMARLSGAVRAADEELWEHLERGQRINPQFYAFRCAWGGGGEGGGGELAGQQAKGVG
jgi:hypothetical protein